MLIIVPSKSVKKYICSILIKSDVNYSPTLIIKRQVMRTLFINEKNTRCCLYVFDVLYLMNEEMNKHMIKLSVRRLIYFYST